MLAFNFSSCRPTRTRSRVQDSRNWLALGVFVVTSVVVKASWAARSRRRADESALLAEISSAACSTRRCARRPRPNRDPWSARSRPSGPTIELSLVEPSWLQMIRRRPVAGVLQIQLVDPKPRGVVRRCRLLPPALCHCSALRIHRQASSHPRRSRRRRFASDAIKTACSGAVSHDLAQPVDGDPHLGERLARPDFDSTKMTSRAPCHDRATARAGSTASSRGCSTSRASRPAAAEPYAVVVAVDDLVSRRSRKVGQEGHRVQVELPTTAGDCVDPSR